MDLESLLNRKKELENGKTELSNSWQLLSGHIAEVDFQIKLLEEKDKNLVVDPIVSEEENPVV